MSYKSSVLTVSLYSDYANFKRVGPNSEEVNIYYKWISSIGYGFSADHSIFSGAFVKVNVQGCPYIFYNTDGADKDKEICDAIQSRINVGGTHENKKQAVEGTHINKTEPVNQYGQKHTYSGSGVVKSASLSDMYDAAMSPYGYGSSEND